MKVKVIIGVYGHKENGAVVPKDKNSEAFEVDDKIAESLIKRGILAKATTAVSEAKNPIRYSESLAPKKNLVDKTKVKELGTSDKNKDEFTADQDGDGDVITYSIDNTKQELFDLAVTFGFDAKFEKVNKKQLVEYLDEVTADQDGAPAFGGDGVVG